MKLEIKHLAPYLAYELKILNGWGDVKTLKYFNLDDEGNGFINHVKPILRPLSDLTKEIEHNGEAFVPIDYINGEFAGKIPRKFEVNQTIRNPNIFFTLAEWISFKELHGLFELLFSWHFDVFGLIDNGLAIDINQTNPSPSHLIA